MPALYFPSFIFRKIEYKYKLLTAGDMQEPDSPGIIKDCGRDSGDLSLHNKKLVSNFFETSVNSPAVPLKLQLSLPLRSVNPYAFTQQSREAPTRHRLSDFRLGSDEQPGFIYRLSACTDSLKNKYLSAVFVTAFIFNLVQYST